MNPAERLTRPLASRIDPVFHMRSINELLLWKTYPATEREEQDKIFEHRLAVNYASGHF